MLQLMSTESTAAVFSLQEKPGRTLSQQPQQPRSKQALQAADRKSGLGSGAGALGSNQVFLSTWSRHT